MKLTLIYLSIIPLAFAFLSIKNNSVVYNGQKVYLSGVNIAWDHYGVDFGRGAYKQVKERMEKWLNQIATNGGNTVRLWLHVDGQHSPVFDTNGTATGEDTESLIQEVGEYLDACEKNNIFAIIVLWNGATKPHQPVIDMYTDEEKLQAYIDNVLTPMVKGLSHKKALGAWEIMNEPGGSVQQSINDTNLCFDTNKLLWSGADWAEVHVQMKDMLKFLNWQIDAIHNADPKVLVTVGAYNERTQTSNTECSYCFNYYTDSCLIAAGGRPNGTMDFYQIHRYPWEGKWSEFSPLLKRAEDYKLDKPLLIGEYPCNKDHAVTALFYEHYYNGGYIGSLSWQYNEGDKICSQAQAHEGMNAIRNFTLNGVIRIQL